MRKTILLAVILAMAMMSGRAMAAVIYDNGAPDAGGLCYSDPSYAELFVADHFVLQTGVSVITDIHWWGAYMDSTQPANDFTITIYDTAALTYQPGNQVYANNAGNVVGVDSGIDFGTGITRDIYYYSIVVNPISLTAGEIYWLEIKNDTGGANWSWATSDYLTGGHALWYEGSWSSRDGEMAFYLTDDPVSTPEPGTLFLLGLGLIGVAGVRRKHQE